MTEASDRSFVANDIYDEPDEEKGGGVSRRRGVGGSDGPENPVSIDSEVSLAATQILNHSGYGRAYTKILTCLLALRRPPS